MTMEAEHHEAHHGEHHGDHPEGGIPELEMVKAFWRERGTHITIVAAVIAVAVFGCNMVRSHKRRSITDASAQLAAARSIQDLEAIVADYGSTPSAPLALLQLAKTSYDMGNFSGAMMHYEGFADKYADHELASVAEVGLIHCREARGELQAAASEFKAFAEANPADFLAPTAQLGQARCLEQLGQFDDARIIYENMVADLSDDSMWGDRAAEQLETLEDRQELYLNPPPVAAPAMPGFALPESLGAPATSLEPITIPAGGSDQ
ncbi:MAG: tetratricopeptide repeat protein [Kiritimatiellia bacterium]|nr:tetratricopeptide repeat protein [Kiritimatiellia bacterium]